MCSKFEEQTAQTFSKLTMEGKVKAALRVIINQGKVGVLPIDSLVSIGDRATKTVHDVWLEKQWRS